MKDKSIECCKSGDNNHIPQTSGLLMLLQLFLISSPLKLKYSSCPWSFSYSACDLTLNAYETYCVAKLMAVSYHRVAIQELAMEKLAITSILSEILNFYEKTEEISEYVLIMENNIHGFKMTPQLFITTGSFTLLTSENSACMHYVLEVWIVGFFCCWGVRVCCFGGGGVVWVLLLLVFFSSLKSRSK